MSKSKKNRSVPNIPPATLLRIRLDGLWQNSDLPNQAPAQITADLQQVTRGLKPDLVVSSVFKAFQAAPAVAQEHLQTVLPGWLAQSNYLPVLEKTLARDDLPMEEQALAQRWLAATGRDTANLIPSALSSFHSAHVAEDEYQSSLFMMWYSNPQRTRARGFGFLIDRNPPWEGALKEAFLLANKPPAEHLRRYVQNWQSLDNFSPQPLEPGETKRRLVKAMLRNREAQIRLPIDLVTYREHFFQHILALPDTADCPPFSFEDFHDLSESGRSAEELAEFEQRIGRRIRLEDGQEVFIDAAIANLSFQHPGEFEEDGSVDFDETEDK